MELSFEVKQKIDDFIKDAEGWLINQPKLPILKLDAKFGVIEQYLCSKGFDNDVVEFTEFEIVDRDTLLANFRKEHPDFSISYLKTELWKNWVFLASENTIETIYISFSKHNDKFDYDLCDELKNEYYHIPENIVIHLHLDYDEGIVFLNVSNKYVY